MIAGGLIAISNPLVGALVVAVGGAIALAPPLAQLALSLADDAQFVTVNLPTDPPEGLITVEMVPDDFTFGIGGWSPGDSWINEEIPNA